MTIARKVVSSSLSLSLLRSSNSDCFAEPAQLSANHHRSSSPTARKPILLFLSSLSLSHFPFTSSRGEWRSRRCHSCLFIIQREKKRKERLLRKEERKELGRGRVSSDPQRSGGETKTNIDTAQEDARRKRALQHVRTLRFAQGARGRNMGRAERRRKRKERRKRTRSPFVAGSHNGDRRASGQSLMQSIYVYRGCCVFVGTAPAGSSPTGRGNRFIGHPVHGI